MPTSIINGVQLFWELTGSQGEPLVLVHGSWIDHHNWEAVVPSLARSFRVLTYDRRGHSRSERPTSPGSIREDAADLAALIEELGLAPAHIVGSSMGGSIVLRLAAECPDLCLSLIVNEPPLFGLILDEPDLQPMLQVIKARIDAVVAALEGGDLEGGARLFVETLLGPNMWEHLPPEVRQTVIANAPTFLDEMHDPEALTLDLARLRDFPQPALLTLGEHGPPFFPPIVDKVAAAMPQAERTTFLGAGHEPEQTHPDLYVATIAEFVTRAGGQRPTPAVTAIHGA